MRFFCSCTRPRTHINIKIPDLYYFACVQIMRYADYLLIIYFNMCVLQLLGAYTYERWNDKVLKSAKKRLFMIPSILLIVFVQHPFHTRIISEIVIFLQTTVLGVTNGITGSVPMIFAPAKVVEERRELAGEYTRFNKMSTV